MKPVIASLSSVVIALCRHPRGCPARPRGGRRRQRWRRRRELPDVVRAGAAPGLQPRRRAAPFVLVRAGDRGVQRRRREGSVLRDGALGHRAQPMGQSVCGPAIAAADRRWDSAAIQTSTDDGLADAARARVHRRRRRAVHERRCRRRSARAPSPTNREWNGSSREFPADMEARIFYALAVESDGADHATRNMRSS